MTAATGDPWEGTRWKVRVLIDGRWACAYLGPGVPMADALRLAASMAHPAHIARVWEPGADPQQWPAASRPLSMREQVA